MAEAVKIPEFGYRYIPGPFQYSAGVAALPGFRIERLRFAEMVPLDVGFARIERHLADAGLATTAACIWATPKGSGTMGRCRPVSFIT